MLRMVAGIIVVLVFTLLFSALETSYLVLGQKPSPTILPKNSTKRSSDQLGGTNPEWPRSIPTGLWDINSNGIPGTLNITSIDSQGRLNGTIDLYPSQQPPNKIMGYFDNDSGKITFVRKLGVGSADIEVYTGYKAGNIIADCISGTGPGSCFQYSKLAGTFQSFFQGNSIYYYSNSKTNTFGWFASHRPLPCQKCPG